MVIDTENKVKKPFFTDDYFDNTLYLIHWAFSRKKLTKAQVRSIIKSYNDWGNTLSAQDYQFFYYEDIITDDRLDEIYPTAQRECCGIDSGMVQAYLLVILGVK